MSIRTKRAADGMPFSLVGNVDRDPIAWLETFPRNADLFMALLEEKRRDVLTVEVREALAHALRDAATAKQAIAQDMAMEAVYAAMQALQGAWIVEGLLGFAPRVQKANASTARSKEASTKAAKVHKDAAQPHRLLARRLASEVPPRIQAQGKSAVARQVKELAEKLKKSKKPGAAHLADLGERQIRTLIFGNSKSVGSDRR